MNFRATRKAKASGIPWIGSVPVTWDVSPMFAVAHGRSIGNVGMIEDNLLSLSFGRIVQKDIKSAEGLLPESFETYQVVEPGDIVFRLTDLQNDQRSLRTAIVPMRGIITSAYIAVQPTGVSSGYLAYLLRAFDLQKVFYSMGGGMRQTMKYEDLRRLPLLLPPASEQAEICDFLDRETARIDALIEKKTRFVELLREKRQAVVTRAVTRGLNPNAATVATGVEWLPPAPTHWTLTQLKHVVDPASSITYGIVQAGPEFDGGIPYIKTSDMAGDHLPTDGYSLTSPEIERAFARSRVRPGDLVISIRASIGKCLPVPQSLPLANLTQGTAKIAPGPAMDKGYLLAFLQSSAAQTYFETMAKGATFKEITLDALRRTPVLQPPIPEQRAVSAFVARATAKLDSLIRHTERSISLLVERRAALITAAVTGQIDVRAEHTTEDLEPA